MVSICRWVSGRSGDRSGGVDPVAYSQRCGRARVGRGADEGSTALGKTQEHRLEAVMDGGEGILRVGPEPAALGPVVRSVDKCFTVI